MSTKLWELERTCVAPTHQFDNIDQYICDNYLIKTDRTIANVFNLSESQICGRRRLMKLTKTNNQIKGKTSIEIQISAYLTEMNIPFIYNTKLNDISANPDFLIDKTSIIEVNGDYWHGNPLVYPIEKLNEIQLRHMKRDIIKYGLYNKNNYRFLVIWEKEINDDFEKVKQRINHFLNILPLQEAIPE